MPLAPTERKTIAEPTVSQAVALCTSFIGKKSYLPFAKVLHDARARLFCFLSKFSPPATGTVAKTLLAATLAVS